jgi:hypothetical protein
LRLVVDVLGRLEDDLQTHVQDIGHDLVGHLEQHDTAIIARVALVAFLGQDLEQTRLPLNRHLLCLPEVEHELVHHQQALVG